MYTARCLEMPSSDYKEVEYGVHKHENHDLLLMQTESIDQCITRVPCKMVTSTQSSSDNRDLAY